MCLGDEVSGFFVDVGGGGIERESEVAFDAGDGRAHLVAGGGDKFCLFSLLGFFLGDVTKNHDDALAALPDWRAGDGDEA